MPFFLRIVPLLAIPTVIYALLAIPLSDEGMASVLSAQFFALQLPSGDIWTTQWSHVLLMGAALLLFVEIVRSARPVNSSIVENSLALLLFVLQLVLFLLVSGFGTNEFATIMGFTLLDFTAGAMVMVFSARRDVQYSEPA